MAKQGRAAILVKEKRLRLTSPPPPASIWPTAVGGARRLRRGGNRGRACACALGSWRMGAGRKALARGRIDALTQSAHARGGAGRESAGVPGWIRGAVGRRFFFGASAVSISPWVSAAVGARAVGRRRGAVAGSRRWSARGGGLSAPGGTRAGPLARCGGGAAGPASWALPRSPPSPWRSSRSPGPSPAFLGPTGSRPPSPWALALAEAAGCVPGEPEWPFSPGGSYVGRGQ